MIRIVNSHSRIIYEARGRFKSFKNYETLAARSYKDHKIGHFTHFAKYFFSEMNVGARIKFADLEKEIMGSRDTLNMILLY